METRAAAIQIFQAAIVNTLETNGKIERLSKVAEGIKKSQAEILR